MFAKWIVIGLLAVGFSPDTDSDGDVDGIDFATFAACFNGAGNQPRTVGCDIPAMLDADDDGDVDGVDFSEFVACFNKAGNPPRCEGLSAVFHVGSATELADALGTSEWGDIIVVTTPRIDMPSSYYISSGVTLTSDGTRENRMVTGNISFPIGGKEDVTISKLTIGGYIDMRDPTNCLVEDCYIDGDVDNTGVRPDHDAYWHIVVDKATTSSATRRVEPRNFERDGFSISYHNGGSATDASGATLVVEDCYVDENSNMGLDFNDQPVTTHNYGHLIVQGGHFTGMPGASAASGSPYSQIDLYDATFDGGYVEFTYMERCTIINGGAKMHTGHMYDCTFENANVLEVYGNVDVKRCFVRCRDWDSPSPTTATGFNVKANASLSVESTVVIGNKRASGGASRAVVGGGTAGVTRSVVITNCLFHNWAFVFNVQSSNFYNAELYNNVFLGNTKLVTALSATNVSGGANYYDGSGSGAIPDGTKFPNGDGAGAYNMSDYANHDFHPVGVGNFITALGLPHTSVVYDLDNLPFNMANPDLGPYVAP